MKTTTTCPHCNRPHEMFWLVQKSGKRDLVFRCDRVPVAKVVGQVFPKDGSGPIEEKEIRMKNTTVPVLNQEDIPQAVLDSLPVEWSRGYRDKKQGQQQLQMVLMKK